MHTTGEGYGGASTAAGAEEGDARGARDRSASARASRLPRGLAAGAVIVGLAAVLRVIAGVGFVNYDTLYALAWGGQLERGSTPAYRVAIAPTPHPLLELLGTVLAPFGPGAVRSVTVALGFLALAACGWVVYRLGEAWFSRLAGAIAAVLLLTRVPVLSYGVRAYVDIPYLLLVLCALLAETGRRKRGESGGRGRVLALLALAGLLRPEAWAFTGLYWLDALGSWPRRLGGSRPAGAQAAERGERIRLTLLAASAPLIWVLSDLLVTGDPVWSLTNTRHTASTLDRTTGIANVPEYIPRRIGEILQPPVLLAAAIGGVLGLLWLRRRAALGAAAGVVAVVVFAAFAAVGLPINTRYAFLAAAILCVFAGAGFAGWLNLERSDPHRRWWLAASAVALVALFAYVPSQYHTAHKELDKLAQQQSIEGDLLALVKTHAITLRCGPVGVPNHAPIPLLALYLKTSPANVISAQVGHIARGVYVDPASKAVEERYVLDVHDPHVAVSVPPGFSATHANRSWLIFERCM